MRKLLIITFVFCGLFAFHNANAQCDSTTNMCQKHLGTDYVSDGQVYRALLNGDETAEFHATFFGGTTYRIVGGSGVSEGNLIFSIYDIENNLLFTNNDHKNNPYWDFEFGSTINCRIEGQLDALGEASGCAVLLIGFKR